MKVKSESEVAQSCLTLCDPMDYILPGFSLHGILQARILDMHSVYIFIGEGNGTPLQYSCLENPMDRGAGRLQSMGS